MRYPVCFCHSYAHSPQPNQGFTNGSDPQTAALCLGNRSEIRISTGTALPDGHHVAFQTCAGFVRLSVQLAAGKQLRACLPRFALGALGRNARLRTGLRLSTHARWPESAFSMFFRCLRGGLFSDRAAPAIVYARRPYLFLEVAGLRACLHECGASLRGQIRQLVCWAIFLRRPPDQRV